jgi:hypothetical protein
MAEQTYQRLHGDQSRLERAIAYVKRGINTNKKYAQGVDYTPELRKKSLAELKDNEAELKRLEAELEKTNTALDKIAAEERAAKGKKEVAAIEKQYAKLNESLSLQLDPNSSDAQDIKDKMSSLVPDYASALTSVQGRAVNKVEARSKLTSVPAPGIDGAKATIKDSQKTTLTPVQSGAELVKKSSLSKTKTDSTVNKIVSDPIALAKAETAKSKKLAKVIPDNVVSSDYAQRNAGMAGVVNAVDDTKKATALAAAAALDLAGTLFEHVPSLKALLDSYVKQGWTNTRFLQELRNDVWYKKNSAEIKTRYTQLYNYQDLVASGQADGSTDYEKQIRTLKDQIIKKAREMGSSLASDPAAIQRAAENMYITNTGIDDSFTNNLIAAAIRPMGGIIAGKPTEGYSGKALSDYQTLQGIAKANGFTMADIIPGGSNEQQVIQGIATGTIDINRIAQDARRLAAQGQPTYVRDLLGQGYNLEQVYAPYRQTMANILEIGDPNQINLNDPTLRMAISDKGDMNLYDFKKALRQDNRWQYTDTAKQEVSGAALSVLRDFGFQG